MNVNGGAISIGHPFGMTGSRQVGHILLEGKRRGAKTAVVTAHLTNSYCLILASAHPLLMIVNVSVE